MSSDSLENKNLLYRVNCVQNSKNSNKINLQKYLVNLKNYLTVGKNCSTIMPRKRKDYVKK